MDSTIRIIYSSPYVPPEWIAAHGLFPSRIIPGRNTRKSINITEGICSYLAAFLDEIEKSTNDSDAVVFTTECDQMRRAPECLRGNFKDSQIFLMNIPSTWENQESHEYYLSELKRLGRFLTRIGGKSPTRETLEQTMLDYNEKRSTLLASSRSMDSKLFSEALANFNLTGSLRPQEAETSPRSTRIPIALLGGPLTLHDFTLFNWLHEYGGQVVLDGTETGERTMPRSFSKQAIKKSPLTELADAYFGYIPDAFRRPNTDLYKWLRNQLNDLSIRGILLVRSVWCDIWAAEVQRLKDWLNIPLLDLDLSGQEPEARTRTRIRAFLETLK